MSPARHFRPDVRGRGKRQDGVGRRYRQTRAQSDICRDGTGSAAADRLFSADTLILRAGDVLFRRDEISNGGFVVLSGSIAMDASDHGATARIVRPPGLIGDLALLTQTRRPATAIAREPSTVLRISRPLFHRVLQEFPDSAERLRQSLSARLGQFLGELGAVRELFCPGRCPDIRMTRPALRAGATFGEGPAPAAGTGTGLCAACHSFGFHGNYVPHTA